MKHTYYSQNGEDYLLYKFFDSKVDGFFIDVGAFDGVHLSNSFTFEKLGWKGICVEANPKYFQLCKKNRPNSVCVNVACIEDPKQKYVNFYVEELGLLSGINPLDDVKKRYESRGLTFNGFKEINVNSMTLNTIIDGYSKVDNIDFISIDVEGTELNVLKGLDLKTYSPRVLLIEVDEEQRSVVDEHIIKNGYFEGRTINQNVFYVRDMQDVAKLKEIIIDCEIEQTIHPLGEEYTIFGKAYQKNVLRKRKGYWLVKKILIKLKLL